MYIYRKYNIIHEQWESQATYFCICFHNFLVTFYWVGDYEREIFSEVKHYRLYFLICFFYISIFFLYGYIYHAFIYRRNAMYESSLPIFNALHDIFKKHWIDLLKNEYDEFLKKEWYNYQFNYNKQYRLRFILFLRLTSIILVILHILLHLTIIYLSFFLVHKWLVLFVFYFEKNFILILITILKIVFLYNFYISLFFNKSTIAWIFFFISYDTNEDESRFIFLRRDMMDIINIYGGAPRIIITDPLNMCRGLVSARYLKKNLKNPDLKILFRKTTLSSSRWIIPKQWKNWHLKDLDCIVSNNYYFSYWFYLQKYLVYILHGVKTIYIKFLSSIYRKHYERAREMGLKHYSYESMRSFQKNKKKFKRIEFK